MLTVYVIRQLGQISFLTLNFNLLDVEKTVVTITQGQC